MDYEGLFADRIGGHRFGKTTELFIFEKIKQARRRAVQRHPAIEILDFGVGEPDLLTPAPVREALKVEIDKAENRGYADNGIFKYKRAAAHFMKNIFGVALDPDSEINHCMGIKSALAMLPLAFVNRGDVIFRTVPGYPILATHAEYLGGEVVDIPLFEEHGYLPDLKAIDLSLAKRCKLFYVNYPNNPTGAIATDQFYDELIAFALQHNILIVQDAAYATLNFSGQAKSILQRPGARECAVELHSMSKSCNMTGWRIAFYCGAAWAVKALSAIKDNCDSGQFKAIQKAACIGLENPSLMEVVRSHYGERLRRLVEVLCCAGFNAKMPGGTFYVYVRAPIGAGNIRFSNAEEASLFLIENCGISTVPWDDTGAFLRFGAVFESRDDVDDERVLGELSQRLVGADLKF